MHETWLDQLPYYVAGALDAADHAALEAHLRECQACRDALDTWTVIAGAVREEVGGRVGALPPLRPPVASSRNGRAAAPSLHRTRHLPEKTEDVPMTVHFPEIASLRPAPQSRSVLTLAAVVLLVVVLGAGAMLLAGRAGDPGNEQPAGLGVQPATPTLPPIVTQTPVPLSSPTPAQISPAEPTATALPEHEWETQAAGTPQVLPSTVVPPAVPQQVLPATPGLSSSIISVPLDAGLPQGAEIQGIRYERQKWNNSGPAALSMALSALGWEGDQAEAAEWLHADADDRGVMLWEMVLFVEQETEYGALHRVSGVPALLKRLVAYGFPVVIPVGFEAEDGEWYGHHWLVAGYDDVAQVFLVYDSYLGAGDGAPREVSYRELDAVWRQFNRAFMIVYPPEDRAEALDELAYYAEPSAGHDAALQMALTALSEDTADAWDLFNAGAAWTELGAVGVAAAAFDKAFELGLPWRTVWYRPEPYAAYYGAGQFEAVMRLADEQSQVAFFEEAAYWRGMVYAAQGYYDLARREFQSALDVHPHYLPAQVALGELVLAELDVPVFPVDRRAAGLDLSRFSSHEIQSLGLPPVPSFLAVTVMPELEAPPPAVVTVVVTEMAPAPIRATPTPIPAD